MAYHPGVGVFKFGDWRPHLSIVSVLLDSKCQFLVDGFLNSVYNFGYRTVVRLRV